MTTGVYVTYKNTDKILDYVKNNRSEEDRIASERRVLYFEKIHDKNAEKSVFSKILEKITSEGFLLYILPWCLPGFLLSRFPGSFTLKWGSAIVLSTRSWLIVATTLGLCWAMIIYEVSDVYTDYTAKK